MAELFDFQEILCYQFDDVEILESALIHSSISAKNVDGKQYRDFDRLEFLGDRVLNLLVAELLYKKFSDESEGDLANRYTALVRFETCATIANEIKLQQFLKVASKTNFDDMRVLCDALEAVIGAMYLDGGINPCKKFVKKHWLKKLESEIKPPSDPKSELQEFVQSKWKTLPVYDVIEKTGLEHMPLYRVSVQVDGIGVAVGMGSSKKEAEKEAAQKLLSKIQSRC